MHRNANHYTWLLLSLASISACEKPKADSKATASAMPVASAALATSAAPVTNAVPVTNAAPATSAAPAASASPAAVQGKPGCRALTVTGLASVDGAPLATASLLDGAHWVELAAGSSVALRHTQTSREFKLIGPGHALPCRDGLEQILLSDGQVSTSANLGVRPGAEVLIATPGGAVHYGDAALELSFGAQGLRVRVKQGEAWVEPEERAKSPFKNPVRSGAEAHLPRAPGKAQSLVEDCQNAAKIAESSARRVLGGEGTAGSDSLGARAAAHMRERAKARTACAIAAAAVAAERDPAKRQSLSASVVQADELWQRVPRAVH